jgi:thioredoxin-like negative regulator of GroEL
MQSLHDLRCALLLRRYALTAASPTVVVLRDGIPVGAFPGALPPNSLDELIREVRALDMDEVRREVASVATV